MITHIPLDFPVSKRMAELPAAPATDWVWHGFLAPGCISLLTSQWKTGKSTLLAILLARLVSLQTARRSGARVAFIDTAPAVESPALAAVRAADFCLIVSRPGILDLRSIGINVEIARLAGKPVALVINAAPYPLPQQSASK